MSLGVFSTDTYETEEVSRFQPYFVDAITTNAIPPNPERYRCGNCKRDRKGCQPSSRTPRTCTWCESNGYICGSLPSQKRRRLSKFKCHQCRTKKIKCEPENREWPVKCQPCIDKNEECSEPQEATRGKKSQTSRPDTRSPPPAAPVPEPGITALLRLSSVSKAAPRAIKPLDPEIQENGYEEESSAGAVPKAILHPKPAIQEDGYETEHFAPAEASDKYLRAVPSSELNSTASVPAGSDGTPLADLSQREDRDLAARPNFQDVSASLNPELLVSLEKLRLVASCTGSLTGKTTTRDRPEGFALNLQQTYSKTIESAEQQAEVLVEQHNFLEAEKLYLNALHCRDRLSENWPYWTTRSDKVTSMLALASLYHKTGETGLRIRVLEDIMKYFDHETHACVSKYGTESKDSHLNFTMSELFFAYTDSYRILTDIEVIQTPLHQAVIFGNPTVVSFVLERKEMSYLDDRSVQGQTALQMATERNSITIARLLVAKNADLDLLSIPDGETALDIAVRMDYFECFCLLFDASLKIGLVDKEHRFLKALAGVIRKNRRCMLEWLLEKDFDFDSTFCDDIELAFITPLEVAIRSKKIEVVAILLERGASISRLHSNDTRRVGLFLALAAGNFRIVEIFLDNGAPINDVEEVPAVAESRIRISPLGFAITRGLSDIAILLIRKGANVHDCAAKGDTKLAPLLLACRAGNERVVRQLIQHGANVAETRGVLQEACALSHQGIVKLLLQHGADPNSPSSLFGRTALEAACRVADENIVRLLLENGGEVNAPNNLTVLWDAYSRGHEAIFELLLRYGADIKSEGNARLLQYARDTGKEGVVRAILFHETRAGLYTSTRKDL
ncbi:ankyrin [Wilcoxina mikolae CBS 423.85]|nr:ankyrin [Wilcoxina mikolae CBS 423.85]